MLIPRILAFLFCFSLTAHATAANILIKPDGSGDQPTIQAGIDAATDGDFVLLDDGTFTGEGNRDISFKGKKITVQPQNTFQRMAVIDCENEGRAFVFNSGETIDSILNFVTIKRGSAPSGGAILIVDSSPSINDCIIEDCTATAQSGGSGTPTGGGGIYIQSTGPDAEPLISMTEIKDCRANTADGGGAIAVVEARPSIEFCDIWSNIGSKGGAIYVGGVSAFPFIANNEMFQNSSLTAGAAIYVDTARSQIQWNVVYKNTAGSTGGGFHFKGSPIIANRNTITDNTASTGGSGMYFDDSEASCDQNIIAFNKGSQGMVCTGARSPLTKCSIIFGNAVSDAVCGDSEDIFVVDPLFCDPGTFDYSVAVASMALQENNSCGLPIGAHIDGCEEVPVRAATWGSLKHLYRD